MTTLNEFLHLYCLKPSTHHRYFKLLPWDKKSIVVSRFPSSFRDWKSRYFFIFGTGQEIVSDNFQGEVPRLLWKWEVPALGMYFYRLPQFFFYITIACLTMFISYSLQLLTVLSWRTSTVIEFVQLLLFLARLRTLMTQLILVIYLTAIQNPKLQSTCQRKFAEKRKVSSSL